MVRRLLRHADRFGCPFLLGSCGRKRQPEPHASLGGATPTLPLFTPLSNQYHCKVSASYMGSSDELVAKLRGGSAGNYDVISPSSDVATSIASAGLAAPLELSKLPSYPQLSPELGSLPLVRVNGQMYSAFYVGAESIDLRHHGIFQTARKLGRILGSKVSREDFRLG